MHALLIAAHLLASDGGQAPAAASRCGPTIGLLQQLQKRYHEVPVWSGQDEAGMDVTVTMSPDGKTWSLVMGNSDKSCMVSAGNHGKRGGPGLDV